MDRASTWRRATLATLLVAGCTHAAPPPPTTAATLTLRPGMTALEVLDSLGFASTAPDVGLLLPTKNRWSALGGLANLRGGHLGDTFAIFAGPQVHLLPDGRPSPVGDVATPTLVRVTLDPAPSPYSWYDRISKVVALPTDTDLAAVLDDARSRCSAFLTEQAAGLAAALTQAGAATPGQPLAAETERTIEVFHPTWTSTGVAAVCGDRAERRSEQTTYGPQRTCGRGLPEEAQPPCQQPPPTITTITRAYAAAVAMVLRYDLHGQLVATETFPPVPSAGPAPLPQTR